ncbi:MAG: DUF2256 domain-containing protein [Rhodospirillaceae bacterium]
MPKMQLKTHLPEKTCVTCNRPFSWRRKWQRDWEHVKFCSERCRSNYRRNSSIKKSFWRE